LEPAKACLSRTNHKASHPRLLGPTPAAEITTLTCSGCGKVGVSICARCSKKPGYKAMIARAHPLQERDPELYKRLDEMSRVSLQENKQLWDEFCREIKAEDFYEHLAILVEIVQEGKWRTKVLNVREWLRVQLARRAKRSTAPEDYGPTGRRRRGGPKFDKRNGALTAFATRPFTEFEVLSRDGESISPDEAIEGQLERKRLQTAGDEDGDSVGWIVPADRDSLRFLGRRTVAERCEASRCAQMADALKHDKATFDQALAERMAKQRRLVERMGLDQDEAEVLAVIELLWDAGPRMYLNFLDEANKRRVRNAWDRFDRRRKNTDFHRTLRELAMGRRLERQAPYPQRSRAPQPEASVQVRERKEIKERKEKIRRNYFMQRFCDWLAAPGVSAIMPSERSRKTHGVVDLPCDLAPRERMSYVSASRKGPASAIRGKLYSE
jgi:hypothetical protein